MSEWQGTLGIDVVYLAANHMSDRGVAGIQLDAPDPRRARDPGTGLGMNLDEALEPAFFDVAGLRVAFVAFNDVGGVVAAGADNAGVAWITRENINDAVQRALDGGADIVMCDPQWWGGREYHDDLLPKQVRQLELVRQGPLRPRRGRRNPRRRPDAPPPARRRDVSLVLASPGNYVFGQDFFQNLQEGVILEQQFVGGAPGQRPAPSVRDHPWRPPGPHRSGG